MLFRSFGLCATMALAANSVLLPPNLSIDALDNAQPELYATETRTMLIKLACPDCLTPPEVTDEALAWPQNVESSLLMAFDISQDDHSFLINDVQFYPPSSGFLDPVYTYQVPSDMEMEEIHASIKDHTAKRLLVGYGFAFDSSDTISEAGNELLPMTFKITSLEGHSVSPPQVTVYIIKNPQGRLMIASIKTTPVASGTASPKENESKECKDWPMLCKWKSILADKLNHIKTSFEKGCHMAGRPYHKPPHVSRPPHVHRPEGPDGQEKPSRPHHPHHHGGKEHHRHHKLLKFLRGVGRVTITVLVPVLVGVAAGMATYLLGMIIGCSLAFLWTKIRGRRQGEYIVVVQDEEEGYGDGDSDDEGYGGGDKVYVEIVDLPAEAPPVYEAVSEKEVVTGEH